MQRRDRSGDKQPSRGGGVDLGKEIMKAEEYPTMKRVMELMREGLWINIANESRESGNRSTLLLMKLKFCQNAQQAQNSTPCVTCAVAACLRGI